MAMWNTKPFHFKIFSEGLLSDAIMGSALLCHSEGTLLKYSRVGYGGKRASNILARGYIEHGSWQYLNSSHIFLSWIKIDCQFCLSICSYIYIYIYIFWCFVQVWQISKIITASNKKIKSFVYTWPFAICRLFHYVWSRQKENTKGVEPLLKWNWITRVSTLNSECISPTILSDTLHVNQLVVNSASAEWNC